MTMTDPIADMLTRLRNANKAHHDQVVMPYSKLKSRIAEILQREGYITSYTDRDAENPVKHSLVITMKYEQRRPALFGLRRISKPGMRVYRKVNDLPKVLGGLGIAIISTSSGLLTDREAVRKGVGGEILAQVW